MSKLTDRISFLKGMAAGMKLNMDKDANKLMLEMLTVMGEMAEEMAAMAEKHNDLNEYVESIDDDLAELEETLFGEEDGEELDEDMDGEEDEDGLTEDDLILYACPHCGHELEFRASDVDFDEDFLCPVCNKPIFPEVEDDE
jgi:rubrerythrin